jgi:hypothetical protein
MSMLDDGHRRQIERALGRALAPDELERAERVDLVTEPMLRVARILRGYNLALCAAYVNAVLPLRGVALTSFVADLEEMKP